MIAILGTRAGMALAAVAAVLAILGGVYWAGRSGGRADAVRQAIEQRQEARGRADDAAAEYRDDGGAAERLRGARF